MEALGLSRLRGKSVLVTGHTGFKGAWLALWLHELGASVHGFALAEEPRPAAYTALGVRGLLSSERIGDLRDRGALADFWRAAAPDLVFHLAAQSLVLRSYQEPLATIETNFMGTAHVLETARELKRETGLVIVTSDKCYENTEGARPFRETDPMGGSDVYSMSKGATELLVASYRRSFGLRAATARAGNVIGGGDFAEDRVLPDCVRALRAGQPVRLRNPSHSRPWQHVLEPLSGYLELGARLLGPDGARHADAYNFGPAAGELVTVQWIVEEFFKLWGKGSWIRDTPAGVPPSEASTLSLDIGKAAAKLAWRPLWDTGRALCETVDWYRAFEQSSKQEGVLQSLSRKQIESRGPA